jgi:multidrug resistance efflux pump
MIDDPTPPGDVVTNLDDTTAALRAVRNLVSNGRNASALRSIFPADNVDVKQGKATLDQARIELKRATPKPALPTPGM